MSETPENIEAKTVVETNEEGLLSSEKRGDDMIAKAAEELATVESQAAKDAVSKSLKGLESNFGVSIELEQFWNGLTESFERNGERIGVLAAKIDENPELVYDIVSKRIKEYAVECADDPVQCVSDLHDKATDFVWDFIVKSENENFKNFAKDIGFATGEALASIGTLGSLNIARVAYLNPELKDPKDYPSYLSKKIKPELDKYLSPESQKQMDIFIKVLAEQISYIDLNELKELFGALEQFAKDAKEGKVSTVATMKTLNKKFLDVAYSKKIEFNSDSILQDLIRGAGKQENLGAQSSPERYKELQNKFITALAKFSLDHQSQILHTYFELENRTQTVPDRGVAEKAINELIVFRCEYCKDINNDDFRDMMQYAAGDNFTLANPKIMNLLETA